MRQAIDLIQSGEKILILTHKNPDGDAVGSVLGLASVLENLGKSVTCFSKDSVPKVFNFLPGVSFVRNRIQPERFDTVILLDCASFSRTGLGSIDEVAGSFNSLLIIDHHPKVETECDRLENCVEIIDHESSSTAALVYNLALQMGAKITKDIATCLFAGIFTDTGAFQHDNTDAETLRIAAELMKKGPRTDKIAKNIFSGKSIPALKLWGRALARVKTDEKTGMAVSYVSKKDLEEYGVNQEDLTGLVSVINTISDAKFSLLLTEYDDQKIRGSLRSEEYKGIDVSRIARSLGGGGHKLASGFEINGEIKDNIAKIKEMVLKAKFQ